MNTILEMVFKAVLYIVGAAIGSLILWAGKQYALPWLKTKLGEARYNAIKARVKDLMAAAEKQITDSGSGKTKSEWVTGFVVSIWPDLNAEYVQAIIDGLVQPLTNEGIINVNK